MPPESGPAVFLAHLGGGHWWEIILYMIPVAIVLGSLGWSVIQERRRESPEDGQSGLEEGQD